MSFFFKVWCNNPFVYVQEQHVISLSVYFPVGKCCYCPTVLHEGHLYEVSFAREQLQTFTAIGKVTHKAWPCWTIDHTDKHCVPAIVFTSHSQALAWWLPPVWDVDEQHDSTFYSLNPHHCRKYCICIYFQFLKESVDCLLMWKLQSWCK